jgi:hypothetical protein
MRNLLITAPGEREYQLARHFIDKQYSLRLGVENPSHAEYFSCITEDDLPIASAGVFLASHHEQLFFERFFDEDILRHIDHTAPRSAFAEIGALAVDYALSDKRHTHLLAATTILSAGLKAYQESAQYIVFVGDKLLSRFSRTFGITFHNLGNAVPKHIDPEFQEKLQKYLKSGRATYVAETSYVPEAFAHLLSTVFPVLDISLAKSITGADYSF